MCASRKCGHLRLNAMLHRLRRPLSPGGRAQLETCLGVAAEAIGVLGKACTSMAQIRSSLPSCTSDSYVYRFEYAEQQQWRLCCMV